MKEPNQYVKGKDLLAEVIKSQELGRVTNELGTMFLKIATKYSTKPSFSGYSYKEEMISLAVLSCCAAYQKFDAEKYTNAFAYFTQCIHNAFLQILNKEKNHQKIRDAILVANEMAPSSSYLDSQSKKCYCDGPCDCD